MEEPNSVTSPISDTRCQKLKNVHLSRNERDFHVSIGGSANLSNCMDLDPIYAVQICKFCKT